MKTWPVRWAFLIAGAFGYYAFFFHSNREKEVFQELKHELVIAEKKCQFLCYEIEELDKKISDWCSNPLVRQRYAREQRQVVCSHEFIYLFSNKYSLTSSLQPS